jgi:hypothetical protein
MVSNKIVLNPQERRNTGFDVTTIFISFIHYGTQLMPSVFFSAKKFGDTGTFVYKMNFLLFYELRQLAIS